MRDMIKRFCMAVALSAITILPVTTLAAIIQYPGSGTYTTLQKAFNAAASGDTIELTAAVTESAKFTGKSITFDLAGNTISGTSPLFQLGSGAELIITDSTGANPAVTATGGTVVTIAGVASGVTVENGTFSGTLVGFAPAAVEEALDYNDDTDIEAEIFIDNGVFSLGSGVALVDASTGAYQGQTPTGISTVITGGTFSSDPSAYNAIPTDAVNGYYAVTQVPGGYQVLPAVATVGTSYYANLNDAVAAAPANGTITLISDSDTGIRVNAGSSVTVDLGGYTLTRTDECPVIMAGGTATFQNGTITATLTDIDYPAIWVQNGSTVTLGANLIVNGPEQPDNDIFGATVINGTVIVAGATINADYGIYTQGDASSVTLSSGTINATGIGLYVNSGSSASVTGGDIIADDTGIYAYNGSSVSVSGGRIEGECGIGVRLGSSLTMTGGAVSATSFGIYNNGSETTTSTTITISGGTVESIGTGACAIYQAGPGTLSLSGTAAVSGPDGIEVRAGTLNIADNATITATAATFTDPVANGGGTTGYGGSAVIVSQHTTNQDISANISGGTLTGVYALYEADLQDTNTDGIALSVTGGTFDGNVASENCTGFVSGGQFKPQIAEALCSADRLPGTTANESGYYTLTAVVANVIRDGAVLGKYNTVDEAIAAATTAGDIVNINVAGTYTLPGLPQNITVEGTVDDVVFSHTSAGNVASIPNGATFKNITFNFGNVNYHGFQHAGKIVMDGCTIKGKLFSYGDMVFSDCNLHQTNSDYNMWCYGGNITYAGCTFVNDVTGKFLNVYNESGAIPYTVVVKDCTFINNGASNKAALNVKATCGTKPLDFAVIVENSTTEGAFPAASTSDGLVVIDSLVQVDDRNAEVASKIAVVEGTDIVLDENYKMTAGTITEPYLDAAATLPIATGYVDLDTSTEGVYTVAPGWVVTFKDYDETELAVVKTAADAVPVYPNAAPTRATTSAGKYDFKGWAVTVDGTVLETLPAATAAATYYAVYDYTAVVASITAGEPPVTTYYTSLADAIDAATAGDTITLEANVEEETTVSKTVTIAKNGHTANLTAPSTSAITETDDGYTVTAAVATVGNTGYATLQKAIDAAVTTGGEVTIKLVNDISGATAAATIPEKANFKLTIDGAKDGEGSYTITDATLTIDGLRGNGGSVNNGASVTIKNIDFVKEADSSHAVYGKNYSHDISVLNCTFTGTSSNNDWWAMETGGSGDATYYWTIENIVANNCRLVQFSSGVNSDNGRDDVYAFHANNVTGNVTVGFNAMKTGGEILIENCNLQSGKYTFRDTSDTYTGTITLRDNTFTSTSEGSDEGAIVVRGGSIGSASVNVESGIYSGKLVVLNNKEDVINISGGLFTQPVLEAYCAEGYIPTTTVVDEVTYYTVKQGAFVAQIGEVKYETLAEAITAAGSDDAIILLANNTETIEVAKAVTITKNGYTASGLTASSDYAVTETSEGYTFATAVAQVSVEGSDSVRYPSLQAAIDAAHEKTGDVTITLVSDITEYVVVHQKEGLNLTIDGQDKSRTITGQIIIDGDARSSGTDTLTISGIKFTGTKADLYTGTDAFILVPSTKDTGKIYTTGKYNYAHNITVTNCSFTGAEGTMDVVGVKSTSGATHYNFKLEDSTAQNVHSLAQLIACDGATITGCNVQDAKSGINFSGSSGAVTIADNTVLYTTGYGIRVKPNGDPNNIVATLNGNEITHDPNSTTDEGVIVVATGTVIVESGSYDGAISRTSGQLSITGGKFTEEPETVRQYVNPETYAVVVERDENGVDWSTITSSNVVVIHDGTTTGYATISAAISAAVDGDTVKLLADTTDEEIVVSKAITLDLNGKTVTTDKPELFTITSTGDLTITGNGTVTGPTNGQAFDGRALIVVDGGTLLIEYGTFTATGSGSDGMYGVYVLQGGTATFGVATDGTGPTISSWFAAIGSNNTTAPAAITVYGGSYTANVTPAGEWWTYFCAPIYAAANGSYDLEGGTFAGYYGLLSSRYENTQQSINIGSAVVINSTSDTDIFVDSKTGTAQQGDVVRTIASETNTPTLPEGYTWASDGNGGYVVAEAVASVGTKNYASLQDAVDAAHEMTGDVTVTLLKDISGYTIIHQKAGLNLTIDGDEHTINGQIVVDGNGRASGTETLTISDITFIDDKSNFCSGTDAFILVPSTKASGTPYYTGAYNYAHNITVDNCTFTSTSASLDVVGIKATSGAGCYNLTVNEVTGSNLHSLAQLTGTTGSTFTDCEIIDSESFINISGGTGAHNISGCVFESAAAGYAVRENSTSTAVITLSDNNFSSAGDVLVIGKGDAATAGTIAVVDGTYEGTVTVTSSAATAGGHFVISGGWFSSQVAEENCAEGYIPTTEPDEETELYTVVRGYKVTFVDYDGETELFAANVPVGTAPVYAGETPTRAADAGNVYTWSGWTYNNTSYGTEDTLATVTDAEQTYTATYTTQTPIARIEVGEETTYFATLDDAFEAVGDEDVIIYYIPTDTDPEDIPDGWAFNATGRYLTRAAASITVGETVSYYATVQDAFDEAEDGDTVTLLKNITEYPLYATTACTLDLNGFTLTGVIEPDFDFTVVDTYVDPETEATNLGTIQLPTLADGETIDGDTSVDGAIWAWDGATVTISGGTYANPAVVLWTEGANVVINGGVFETYAVVPDAENCAAATRKNRWDVDAVITVTDGEFNGSYIIGTHQYAKGATLNIEGGWFKAADAWSQQTIDNEGVSVSGGYFAQEPVYLAEGYVAAANTDEDTNDVYPFTVDVVLRTATITSIVVHDLTQSANITVALNNWKSGTLVKLWAKVDYNDAYWAQVDEKTAYINEEVNEVTFFNVPVSYNTVYTATGEDTISGAFDRGANVVGTLAVTLASSEDCVVGVPYSGIGEFDTITVAELFQTTTLEDGDTVYTLSNEYVWNASTGTWEADDEDNIDQLVPGSAVVFYRRGGGMVRINGEVKAWTEKQPWEEDEAAWADSLDSDDGWNMVASVNPTALNVQDIPYVGLGDDDSLWITDSTGIFRELRWDGSQWYYSKKVYAGWDVTVTKVTDLTIAAGSAFWYVNND